jgi:CyaY protein
VDDQTFQKRADEALDDLYKRLASAADLHDFEVDFNAGTLKLEFEDPPAKFVVSPNSPVRQIWVSAHMKSYKLGWDEPRQAFVLPDTGLTLEQVMADAVAKQLGDDITL